MVKQFIEKNKVFLLGLLGAIGLGLSSFVGQPEFEIKPLVYAVIAAAVSYLANNLRGQWVSIAGIFGTMFSTFMTMETTGTISWNQLILQGVVMLLSVVAPPPKPEGYEQTKIISDAMTKGEAIQEKKENEIPPQL